MTSSFGDRDAGPFVSRAASLLRERFTADFAGERFLFGVSPKMLDQSHVILELTEAEVTRVNLAGFTPAAHQT